MNMLRARTVGYLVLFSICLLLTGTAAGESLPDLALRLGTTLATNALLTRAGAPTALFITEGFADLLAIGTQ